MGVWFLDVSFEMTEDYKIMGEVVYCYARACDTTPLFAEY